MDQAALDDVNARLVEMTAVIPQSRNRGRTKMKTLRRHATGRATANERGVVPRGRMQKIDNMRGTADAITETVIEVVTLKSRRQKKRRRGIGRSALVGTAVVLSAIAVAVETAVIEKEGEGTLLQTIGR